MEFGKGSGRGMVRGEKGEKERSRRGGGETREEK